MAMSAVIQQIKVKNAGGVPTVLTRPKRASISCSAASASSAGSAVSAAMTALLNQGWSETGTGAVSYQVEIAVTAMSSPAERRWPLRTPRGVAYPSGDEIGADPNQ